MALFHMNCVLQVLAVTASLSFLLCAVSSEPSISLLHPKSTDLPSTLKYFVHALDSGAASIVQPVNSASYGTFGQASVFAYNIHEGSDLTSEIIGTIRGLEIYNSMNKNDSTILLLNTVVYNDGVYNGTVSIHGQGNISETDYELPIVGGTGSFRGAAGYAAIHNLQTSGDDHVFEHELHFLWGAGSMFCSSRL